MTTLIACLLAAYLAAALAYWLWAAYAMLRVSRGIPRMAEVAPPAPSRWPRLSVIVPAANEADKIEAAARTLLAEDYPDLQIILVDDRSTDGTGAIIDRLAAQDGRAMAIHITDLPDGWLGKVNALQTGLREATGEFVLFTDADIHFARGTLRKAVAYAAQERLDHLAAFPELWPTTVLLDAVIAAFIRQLFSLSRPWAVSDPKSRAFCGIGAFNLVRRTALDATPGLEWLRMETGDDMALGLLMKRSGARCGVIAAFGYLGLVWYRSIAEMARGAERGWATVLGFSFARAVVMALVMTGLELGPFLALLPLATEDFRIIGCGGIAVTAAYLATVFQAARWAGWTRLVPGLVGPLTAPLAAAMILRSAWLGRRRGGVVWRGTLYRDAQLRAGRRVAVATSRIRLP